MGLGSSKFSLLPANKITSKEDYMLKTKEMTGMADALFTFMFRSSSPDLEAFNIAEQPEKYVVALSELIKRQFNVLGYTTTRTVQGEIYFSSYEKLNPAKLSLAEQADHRKNCKLVAFFFVRIYQILGSMLMIIKDSSLEDVKVINDPYLEREYIGQKLPQVYYTQRGGAVDMNIFLGPLEILRSSLVNPDSEDIRYVESTGNKISESSKLYKITDTDLLVLTKDYNKGVSKDQINNDPPIFIILCKDRTNNYIKAFAYPIYIINMYNDNLNDNKSLLSINFRVKTKKVSERETEERNRKSAIKLERKTSINEVSRFALDTNNMSQDLSTSSSLAASYYKTFKFGNKSNIKFWLNFYFFFYATGQSPNLDLKTPGEEIRAADEELPIGELSDSTKMLTKGQITNEVISGVYNELLKGTKAYDTISAESKTTPPSGKHCVKRAIQLLNAESIFKVMGSNEESYTRICKFSAPDKKESEVPFDMFTPTKTFAQLYGKIRVNPNEFEKTQEVLKALIRTRDSGSATNNVLNLKEIERSEDGRAVKTETNDLKDALVRLQEAFKLLNEPASKEAPKGFNDIKMKIPNECGTITKKAADSGDIITDTSESKKKDGAIKIKNDNMIRQLRDISQELLAYHVNSTIEITKFLETIFNISKDSSGNWRVLGIKESLLIAGFPALDSITDIARDLLLKYYEGCEAKYQKGVKIWIDENKAAVAAPVPAAAPAAIPVQEAVAAAAATAAAAAAAPVGSAAPAPAPAT
jgi:hypothetical protein